jgi:hypothetical protein
MKSNSWRNQRIASRRFPNDLEKEKLWKTNKCLYLFTLWLSKRIHRKSSQGHKWSDTLTCWFGLPAFYIIVDNYKSIKMRITITVHCSSLPVY